MVTRAWANVSREQNVKIKRLLIDSKANGTFLFFSPIRDLIPNVRTTDAHCDSSTWDFIKMQPKETPRLIGATGEMEEKDSEK